MAAFEIIGLKLEMLQITLREISSKRELQKFQIYLHRYLKTI